MSSDPNSQAQVLRALAHDGQLGLGVPVARGGRGGDLAAVVHAVAREAEQSLARATVFAAQRLLIEVLLQADNVGIVEYRLPSLLEGEIAGNCYASWPSSTQAVSPAIARDTGRHWRINGQLAAVPNIASQWFLASAPVAFEGGAGFALVLLKSEEDGVDRDAASPAGPHDSVTNPAGLTLRDVFFWEDEILSNNGPALVQKVQPLARALHAALAAAVASKAV